jgi:phosphoglycolate phosphatase-like HAD superfamily hydrolase
MPVLLFDIDGTLLQSHGVGRRSVNAALAALAGETFDFSDVTFSGKTDRQIFREVLEAG